MQQFFNNDFSYFVVIRKVLYVETSNLTYILFNPCNSLTSSITPFFN